MSDREDSRERSNVRSRSQSISSTEHFPPSRAASRSRSRSISRSQSQDVSNSNSEASDNEEVAEDKSEQKESVNDIVNALAGPLIIRGPSGETTIIPPTSAYREVQQPRTIPHPRRSLSNSSIQRSGRVGRSTDVARTAGSRLIRRGPVEDEDSNPADSEIDSETESINASENDDENHENASEHDDDNSENALKSSLMTSVYTLNANQIFYAKILHDNKNLDMFREATTDCQVLQSIYILFFLQYFPLEVTESDYKNLVVKKVG
jgi:hypothetical protein